MKFSLQSFFRSALSLVILFSLPLPLVAFPVSFYYEPTPGTGFFDQTPVSPVGGNSGTTLGEQRKIAAEHAVRWWASRIVGDVTINVKITSEFDAAGSQLADAVPQGANSNWTVGTPPPQQNVFYPSILAAQISGVHQPTLDPPYDVVIRVNTAWDSNLRSFYYGLDGKPGIVQHDFFEIMLHEFAHGLGMVKGSLRADGTYNGGFPYILTLLTTDSAGNPIVNMTASERMAVMTSDGALIGGPILQANNGGQRARWHSPNPYVEGASIAHFDEATYSFAGSLNSLMTPEINPTPTHVVGPLTLDLLRDMGYVFADDLPPVIGIDFPVEGRPVKGAPILRGTATDTAPGGSANAVGMLKVRTALYSEAEGKWYRWTPGNFDSVAFNATNHVKDAVLDNIPIPTGTRNWSLKLPPGLAEGNYQLHVSGVDQLHQDTSYVYRTFTLDNTAPKVHFAPYAAAPPVFDPSLLKVLTEGATNVTLTIRRGVSGTEYWNGTAWAGAATPISLPMTSEGNGSFKPGFQLPGRGDWQPGSAIHFETTATDAASNATIAALSLNRTVVDTTTPIVTISSPPDGAVYSERALAIPFGTALDAETDISFVGVYLMRLVPGGGFKYWTGHEWSDNAAYLPSNYQPEDKRWWTPALGYRLPSDTELPDATYKIQAVAYNREVPQQGSTLVERTFRIAVNPPQVSITSPAHSGFVKEGWTISGTATDLSDTGFDQNGVTFTLVGSDGRYWDGAAWNVNQRILEAVIQPDGTWSYPAAGSGDTLPLGETQYSISASVKDRNGNVSLPVAGGLAGNNQVIFKVDTTPPTCVIASPTHGTVITQPPLLASIFNGTASDSSGQPQVTLYLKRLSDGYYWTGSNWTSTVTQASLPGIFEGGAESDGWVNQVGFPCLNQYFSGMQNGDYELIAIAQDAAGNQTQRSADLFIEYNPVWLGSKDLLARVLPKQTPPIDGNTVTSNLSHTFTTWLTGQEGDGSYPTAKTFTADSQGRYFVTNRLTQRVFLGGARTYDKNLGVIQRVGAGGWRRQRTTFFISDGSGNISYFERWSPGGPAIPISPGEDFFEVEPGPVKTDAAGNTYATFNLRRNSDRVSNLAHALVVKFDADGNLVWRRIVPELGSVEPPNGWLAQVEVSSMDILSDGSVSLVLENRTAYHPDPFNHRVNTVVARLSPSGVAQSSTRLGSLGEQGNLYVSSSPLYSAVDGSGNAFVITREGTQGDGYTRQVLRKISADGTVLATLETSLCGAPQYWEKLATDSAGHVYVLGTFDLGTGDGRCCVTKYDSSLNQVWRSFGPERSVYIDPFSSGLSSGGDYRFHVGSQGITIVHYAPANFQTEYPDQHPLILRFSLAGDLVWARAVAKTDTSVNGLDGLSQSEVTPAGDVLFTGFFSGGQGQSAQSIYGKISNAGDLQFYSPITVSGGPNLTTLLPDGRLAVLHTTGFSLSPSGEQYIKVYGNPATVLLPVTLDAALPGSRTVASGESVEFKVINRGSAGTYQWRKENAQGVPQNIAGATGDVLSLQNIQSSDAGRYSCVVTNAVAPPATSRTAVLTVLQQVPLDVALDTPGRVWTSGGDVPWKGFASPSPSHDNVDAAASGTIGDNQSSWVETTVTGPVEVSFWWKIQSEFQADPLTFSVNGTPVGDSISSDRDWAKVTHALGAGQHVLRWTFARDESAGFGVNKAWLDTFTTAVPVVSVPLNEALDNASLTFTTGGNAVWRGVSPTPSHDGVDSAVSGDIGNNGQSWVETTVTGPGMLSFWWKVSSEIGFDYLEFYVDDVRQSGRISGEVDWQQKTYTLGAGSHTLRWLYKKDNVFDGGLDLGWVDQIAFGAAGGNPEIAVEEPVGVGLTDGASTVVFGTALPGNNLVKTFTIRNSGTQVLNGLAVSKDGTNSGDFTVGALGATTVNPGESTSFTVTFMASAPGARSAAIHIANNDADENPFDIALTGTGGIPIATWRQQHFGTSANTGNAADDFISGADGIKNLMKFATGGIPGANEPLPTPVTKPVGGTMTFNYPRNKLAMGELSFQVEWSDTLSGTWSAAGVVESIVSDNGTIQQVQATLPAGSEGERFVRLKIMRP